MPRQWVIDMSYVKIATVVKRLHDRTNRGDVRWEQIFDADGALLEEVADPDLKDFLTDPFKVMRTIDETARRSAMGVEQALDRILGALGDERPS
jgi:hypothetical protein